MRTYDEAKREIVDFLTLADRYDDTVRLKLIELLPLLLSAAPPPQPAPHAEDVRKLHAEVNQLMNQRFLILTAAVTLFGVVIGWSIPKTSPPPVVSPETWMMSLLLMGLLFLLFLLAHFHRMMIRNHTIYLTERGLSAWEADWLRYRSKPHFSYSRAQAAMFLFLGLLTAAWPLFVALACQLSIGNAPERFVVHALATAIYVTIVVGVGFRDWFLGEDRMRQRWKAALATSDVG